MLTAEETPACCQREALCCCDILKVFHSQQLSDVAGVRHKGQQHSRIKTLVQITENGHRHKRFMHRFITHVASQLLVDMIVSGVTSIVGLSRPAPHIYDKKTWFFMVRVHAHLLHHQHLLLVLLHFAFISTLSTVKGQMESQYTLQTGAGRSCSQVKGQSSIM